MSGTGTQGQITLSSSFPSVDVALLHPQVHQWGCVKGLVQVPHPHHTIIYSCNPLFEEQRKNSPFLQREFWGTAAIGSAFTRAVMNNTCQTSERM